MNCLLKEYIAIVHFFGKIVGKNTEIILHDISQVDHSVVAIVNGHISGRKIGSSLNAAGISFIKSGVYKDHDELLHYKGLSKGGIELICYTRFIKDNEGALLGMMCVNIDKNQELKMIQELAELFNLSDEIAQELVHYKGLSEELAIKKEYFPENVTETINAVFEEIVQELNLPKDRLTYVEKVTVMKKLEEKGVFLFKGAIPEVARLLSISEATAYRYLSKIERGEI